MRIGLLHAALRQLGRGGEGRDEREGEGREGRGREGEKRRGKGKARISRRHDVRLKSVLQHNTTQNV